MTQLRARVVTVSDRAAAGDYPDRSGPLAVELLSGHDIAVDEVVLVPDDGAAITVAVRAAVEAGVDLCLTTGGTGIGPRDGTPEAVTPLLDVALPGIAEALRCEPRERIASSMLSRGVAGIAGGRTLVVTLAGSTGAVRDGVSLIGPLVGHVAGQLAGRLHEPAGGGQPG